MLHPLVHSANACTSRVRGSREPRRHPDLPHRCRSPRASLADPAPGIQQAEEGWAAESELRPSAGADVGPGPASGSAISAQVVFFLTVLCPFAC